MSTGSGSGPRPEPTGEGRDAADEADVPGHGTDPPGSGRDTPDRREGDVATGEFAAMPGAPAEVPNPQALPADEPITVVISRLVRPGSEAEYDAWIHEAAGLLADHDGFEGMTALPPGQHHSGPEHVLVLRFRDYPAMRRWKRSQARRDWIGKLSELTVDTGAWQEQSGLETWFTLPDRVTPTGPPPRWKQALLTTVGLLPLLVIVDLLLGPLIGGLPLLGRLLVTTPLVVAAMAWLVMPGITRLAYRWLYPGQSD